MGNGRISAKQAEILEYIKAQILEKGYPPAVREICSAVHLKSTSSVHSHLETLEKNGYIRRDPTKPRAIEIIDDDFNLSRREMLPPVPHYLRSRISKIIFQCLQTSSLPVIYLCLMSAVKV